MTDDEQAPRGDAPDATGDDGVVDAAGEDEASDGIGGRDVEVPMDVYKAVTVFSTLFAVVFVVVGFVLLDTATQRATAAPEDVNLLLTLVGLGTIALGAGTYAFSTRFRAREMGNSKDDAT